VSAELAELMQQRKDIIFFNVQGLISFHSASNFEHRILGFDMRPLILRMKDVKYIDTTGLMTLNTIVKRRHELGSRVMLSAIQPTVHARLKKFGVLNLVGAENIFDGTALAIASVPESYGNPDSTAATDEASTAAQGETNPT
jgi:anti-anti-sigma factor